MVFKIFKKNKSVENKEKMKKNYGYRITVCDPLGESLRELKTFGANKGRDDDGIVTLNNQDEGFEEIFPLDNDQAIRKTKEDIDKELKYWENYKPGNKENPLNKEQKLYSLHKQKKALDYKGGSFLKIDKDGMPHIYYVRYRSAFIPLKWNLDFSHVHTPTEPLIKNVLVKEREKKEKYKQKQQGTFTVGMMIAAVILLIWTAGLGWYSLHWFDKVDNSKVNEINNRIDDMALKCGELYGNTSKNFYEASKSALNITKSYQELLNPQANVKPKSESVR